MNRGHPSRFLKKESRKQEGENIFPKFLIGPKMEYLLKLTGYFLFYHTFPVTFSGMLVLFICEGRE